MTRFHSLEVTLCIRIVKAGAEEPGIRSTFCVWPPKAGVAHGFERPRLRAQAHRAGHRF